MGTLDGRVALVTGAGNGIGAASAARLAREGAEVLVTDTDVDAGRATAATVGGRFARLDVTDEGSWAAIVAGLERLDVVHLNAGVMARPRGAPFLDDPLSWITSATYRKVFGVNVEGVLFGILAARPLLEASGGDIVVTASVVGMAPQAEDPLYSASKHAVLGLVRSLGPLLANLGIRLNAVCPGAIDTDLVPADLAEAKKNFSPPAYIADAVMHAIREGGSGRCWIAYRQGEQFSEYTWPNPRPS